MTNRRRHATCVNTRVPQTFEAKLRETISNLSPGLRNDYLRQEIFSKYVSSETDAPDVRRQRAINKWLSVEVINRSTNERLINVDPEYQILPRVTWRAFIDKLSSIVSSIIGDVPSPDILLGGFSGGASTSRMRTEGHPSLKFEGEAHVTPRALSHACGVLLESQAWLRYGNVTLKEVPGNDMFTVPKNAEIDRVAAKEPDLNMYMQRGVGDFIRKRLHRFGIDLNDQSRNRSLAELGSSDQSLATLDLSSASDSVTTGLVFECLSPYWYTLLSDLRSEVTRMPDGDMHVNEMFSSMGNGFTFELESLLFYSISRTVAYFEGVSGVISVYGDDIIAPTALVHPLIWVLSFLGFSINMDKSHYDSTFRESCGGHYDGGLDITPFYVRKPIEELTDLIEILNKIRKFSEVPGLGVLDPELLPIWELGRDLVPRRLWGGRDVNSNTSLVTPDCPRERLSEITKRVNTGFGGYIHRLATRGGVETTLSSRSRPSGRFEFRRVRVGYTSDPIPWYGSDGCNA